MNNKLDNIIPKKNDILMYQNNNTLLLFKYAGRVPSGFVKVDKNYHKLLAGRKPIGLDQGNFIINYSIVDIFTKKDKHDYVDIPFESFIYRLYRNENMYEANNGLSPDRILESITFYNYTCLKLKKK